MNLTNLRNEVHSRLFHLLVSHTDTELAAKLKVSKRTIQNWKRDTSGMTITMIERMESYYRNIKEG